MLLGEVFPIDRVELEPPKAADPGLLGLLLGGSEPPGIPAADVAKLAATPGVRAAFPKLRFAFPASARGGKSERRPRAGCSTTGTTAFGISRTGCGRFACPTTAAASASARRRASSACSADASCSRRSEPCSAALARCRSRATSAHSSAVSSRMAAWAGTDVAWARPRLSRARPSAGATSSRPDGAASSSAMITWARSAEPPGAASALRSSAAEPVTISTLAAPRSQRVLPDRYILETRRDVDTPRTKPRSREPVKRPARAARAPASAR